VKGPAPFEAIIRTPWDGPWRRFANPVAVLQTSDAAQIRDYLRTIDERSRREGLFAAGFATYEAAGAFGLPVHASRRDGLPLLCFGLFAPEDVTTLSGLPGEGSHQCGAWIPSIDHETYLDAIKSIKDRIEAGDTYQINFTFRLDASFEGDPISLMRSVSAAQGGEWGAFVDIGSHAICSASPELFFRLTGRRIECRPMKGTTPRGLHTADDRQQAERLRQSAKNRAENVMVVDMVRNDLGRLARFGSVNVSSLFELERFPAQWQMTSTVVAELADPPHLERLFEALFPSGSVTGAPKHSSMEIIRGLEPRPRGIYTGAIGYLAPGGDAHFNVAIRTVTIDMRRQAAEFGVGSGVVWDSLDRDEYAECLLKASILLRDRPDASPSADFELLETMKWSPAEGFALLERHLARLFDSADYFGFTIAEALVRKTLASAIQQRMSPTKVRLRVARDGTAACDVDDLTPPPAVLRAALATEPVDVRDVFLYHKTTRRHVYDAARASRPDADAVILWNQAGELTEGTIHNLVVEVGGRRLTPPIECGLLAGTMRAQMLESGAIEIGRIAIDDLVSATGCWLINSVSGMVPATIDPASASIVPEDRRRTSS